MGVGPGRCLGRVITACRIGPCASRGRHSARRGSRAKDGLATKLMSKRRSLPAFGIPGCPARGFPAPSEFGCCSSHHPGSQDPGPKVTCHTNCVVEAPLAESSPHALAETCVTRIGNAPQSPAAILRPPRPSPEPRADSRLLFTGGLACCPVEFHARNS